MKRTPNRRAFLKAMGVGAAAMTLPGSVRAQDMGLEVSDGPYKVLEIFLNGGLSHRDTLWLHPEGLGGCPVAGALRRSQEGDLCGFNLGENLTPNCFLVNWDLRLGQVRTDDFVLGAPDIEILQQGLARCSPALSPLNGLEWRVVATRHEAPALFPHEPAAALTLTGSRNGRADQAGMGAAVLAAAALRAGADTAEVGTAFVFHCPGNELQASFAAMTGLHGSHNRPIVVRMGDGNLIDRVARASSASPHHKALAGRLRNRYGDRLVHYGNHAVRSDAFAEYQATNDVLGNPNLAGLLDTASLNIGAQTLGEQVRGMILGGIDLLRSEDAPTEYVCAITPNPLGGEDDFDTHNLQGELGGVNHAEIHNVGLYIILDAVARGLAEDGSDDILVVVHSEFGRAITPGDPGDYTGHWPNGGAALFIGGPTVSGSVGGFDEAEFAMDALTPRDIRCALYQAMDIDPFGTNHFTTDSVVAQRRTTVGLLDPVLDGRKLSAVDDADPVQLAELLYQSAFKLPIAELP